MLQTNNNSLVLLTYDLCVNSLSELLRAAPVIQLVLFMYDIASLFNVIIILLMMFNTSVFQVGLVALLLERFKGLLMLCAIYLTISISFHCSVVVLLYYYFYKRTTECLGDPRPHDDSG
ncbi:transmembrane protein 138 [Salvelinus namaycush]|uniref:Transmembrane protein 138 n=1 Tax=Salvelinus namaycush TaxID=8040 RepID=A0A8U1FAF0_SALNM|nr:transmembrane protein 138 [Salvelinus namaycush]